MSGKARVLLVMLLLGAGMVILPRNVMHAQNTRVARITGTDLQIERDLLKLNFAVTSSTSLYHRGEKGTPVSVMFFLASACRRPERVCKRLKLSVALELMAILANGPMFLT